MNNIIEYKDWLFVAIPDELGDFQMSYMQADNDLILVKPDTSLKWITTLPGGLRCWQIIGKGDQLSESDWEGVVQLISNGKISGRKQFRKYDDTTNIPALMWVRLATASGHSLLRSLNLEPEKTLVLKKNEK